MLDIRRTSKHAVGIICPLHLAGYICNSPHCMVFADHSNNLDQLSTVLLFHDNRIYKCLERTLAGGRVLDQVFVLSPDHSIENITKVDTSIDIPDTSDIRIFEF
mmetsp:Transcript_29044/g.33215  ORF Transcript_29044/g.33215 Transcript_29044/m.33215 type:complete len:104 (-) Transcript_29044:461-772(-)